MSIACVAVFTLHGFTLFVVRVTFWLSICVKNTPMVAAVAAPRMQMTQSRHSRHCESVRRLRWVVEGRVTSTRRLLDQRVESERYG
ncbi:hypothetical protein F5141DRAFT_1113165 [Pisolithus sp. B1]|nr:hypothetical protein F5141DRAFT_1113165 [Pisolithus sp. B1]